MDFAVQADLSQPNDRCHHLLASTHSNASTSLQLGGQILLSLFLNEIRKTRLLEVVSYLTSEAGFTPSLSELQPHLLSVLCCFSRMKPVFSVTLVLNSELIVVNMPVFPQLFCRISLLMH